MALGFAVPQVIAHRMARMGDRKEMQRMGVEKVLAATEAWNAMALQALVENQKLGLAFMQSFWSPGAAFRILGKGMAPVTRRATANAKRLGRTRRRRS
jgi:hypothetical protein